MRFSGNILIEMGDSFAKTIWLDKFPTLPPIEKQDGDDEHLEAAIGDWLEMYGRAWMDEFTGGENSVNCPDGTLTPGDVDREVPTTATPDMWYCKNTGKVCPIQALIPLDNKKEFLKGCNIEIVADDLKKTPKEYKEGLFHAVQSGEFTGEHHQLAREGCWRCQQKSVDDDLYSPWELTTLYDHIGEGGIERKIAFRRAGLESWVGHPICANCFLKLPDMFSDIDFNSWGLDVDRYKTVPYELNFD